VSSQPNKCACRLDITDLDGHVVRCDYCRRKWYRRDSVPANQGAEYSEEYKVHAYRYDHGNLVINSPQKADINGVRPISDVFDKRPEVLTGRTYYHPPTSTWVTLTERDGRPAECFLSGSYVTDETRALASMVTFAFKNSASVDTLLEVLPVGHAGGLLSCLRRALEDFAGHLEGRVTVVKNIADVFEEGGR
jgi:hypothetical protein